MKFRGLYNKFIVLIIMFLEYSLNGIQLINNLLVSLNISIVYITSAPGKVQMFVCMYE